MLTTIELRSDPAMRRLVTAAFPGYRKHRAFLSVFGERGQNVNSYWSGGSRDEHVILELATLRRKALPTSTHPYFDIAGRGLANTADPYVTVDHVGNVTLRAIPPGFALVTAGTFCGKPATAHIHVNAVDMPRLLPKGQ